MKYLFLIAISTLIVSSCKSTQKNARSGAELFIEENQWEMVTFKGKSLKEAGFIFRTPIVVINKEKGKIGGNNGCNSFGGNAIVMDKTIEMSMFLSTKMYCEGVPEQEFFDLLEGTVDYTINNNELTFTKDHKIIMIFKLKRKE